MTGVTIVTSMDEKTGPAGLAANSFTSVSLRPPLVLISVDLGANSSRALERSGRYAAHILGAHQEALCRRFARSDLSGTEKLEGVSWIRGLGGVPLLDDYLARFECRVVQAIPGGDHVVYLGEVERLDFEDTELPPLGFFRGGYLSSPGLIRCASVSFSLPKPTSVSHPPSVRGLLLIKPNWPNPWDLRRSFVASLSCLIPVHPGAVVRLFSPRLERPDRGRQGGGV